MKTSRRQWLVLAGSGLTAVGLGRWAAPARGGSARPWNAAGVTRLTGADEPGEAMFIEGRVLRADGVTPAAGVVVYAYQTDAGGLYWRPGQAPKPRLRAWMRTDGRGRFAYLTIRPGHYPGRRTPSHIHTQLWGGGAPVQYGTTLHFDDDPLFRRGAPNRWLASTSLRRDRGVWRGRHAITLRSSADPLESNTRHGVDHAPPGFRPTTGG